MSEKQINKKKETQKKEQQQKIVTRYDKKMQRRKEEKEREEKQKKITLLISSLAAVLIICFIVSFPIRSYIARNQSYIKIGQEEITREEFEYYYNMAKNNYINQYGVYLSYMGLDVSQNLETQMYTDTLTWKDYFEEVAVNNIIQNKALKAQAEAEGFSYDVTQEYEAYETSLKEAASEANMSIKNYMKQLYGGYATENHISEYIKEEMELTQYYQHLTEQKAPTEEEITQYYNENKDNYDVVDYRLFTVQADLPESETEEETEDNTSEAVQEAMTQAEQKAKEALNTIVQDGELKETMKKASVSSLTAEWLFDTSRKQGDTTIIEDTTNHQYYVLAFEKRYLDETPTVDIRVLVTEEDGEVLLETWKNGEATEESFAKLCQENSTDTNTASEGGFLEQVAHTDVQEVLADWLFDTLRVNGDTTAITDENGTSYVMYYIGQNKAEWENSIQDTLASENMTKYVEEITANYEVEDTKGKLHYLTVKNTSFETESQTNTEIQTQSEDNGTDMETQTTQETQP